MQTKESLNYRCKNIHIITETRKHCCRCFMHYLLTSVFWGKTSPRVSWYSIEVFCSNQWAELVLLEVPLICLSVSPKGELFLLKQEKLIHLSVCTWLRWHCLGSLTCLPFPLAGRWCGSLAKKKIWQRNPCTYGGGQPLGCWYAYVWVHRHTVFHTVFTSLGFLAKSQRDRCVLAVSCVDFCSGNL